MGDIVVGGETRVRDESGRFIAACQEGARRAAAALADEIVMIAMTFAPVETGVLVASIEPEYHGVTAYAKATAPYAAAQEKGAGPHDIPNSFGYGPEFGIGGRFGGMFHPGNPAVHYLRDAGNLVGSYGVSIVAANMP